MSCTDGVRPTLLAVARPCLRVASLLAGAIGLATSASPSGAVLLIFC